MKGKAGGEGPEVGVEVGARASWVKGPGLEQGIDQRMDHHDDHKEHGEGDEGDAVGGAAQGHGPYHEAHVTSARWLAQ